MDKELILNIETASSVCSVTLSMGGETVSYRESEEKNSHSARLPLLIEDVFKGTGYTLKDLDAVAVSKGPGSYTGLRIGVSSAKGIAYGRNIPLISVETLQILAKNAKEKIKADMYLPMIDARRMEVYSAVYDGDYNTIKEVSADIIDSDIYKELRGERTVAVIGDGADKCRSVLSDSAYIYDSSVILNAKGMPMFAHKKFMDKEFEDVAYFEPYYLKEFIAEKSHVKGLR